MTKAKNLKISLLCVFLLAPSFISTAHAQKEKPANDEGKSASPQTAEVGDQAPDAPTRFSPTPEEILSKEQKLLAERAPETATPIWIDYKDTKRLALWRPSSAATPLGAVLAVFDRGEHLLASPTISNALENLPHHGWATFSIYLSDLPEPSVPERPPRAIKASAQTADDEAQQAKQIESQQEKSLDETSEPVDETQVVYEDDGVETETTGESPASKTKRDPPSIPPEELAEGLIAAAIAQLQSLGQYNIVLLGEGLGATRALAYIAGEGLSPPPSIKTQQPAKAKAVIDRPIRALILVDTLHLHSNASVSSEDAMDNKPPSLESLLSTPSIPTLDLSIQNTRLKQQQALSRKRSAKAQKYQYYIQRKWPTAPVAADSQGENKMTRAIRHFLEAHAKGVQLE